MKKRLLPSTHTKKSTEKPKRRKAKKDGEEEKPAETSQPQPGASKGPIAAPLHRQAQRRLASGIAYEENRQEMHKWAPVIMDTRTAEQIHFPLGEPRRTDGRAESGADKAKGFEPRTQLELLTAEVLGQSKYNLKNREPYCEAEKEILKAMSVKEVGGRLLGCGFSNNNNSKSSGSSSVLRTSTNACSDELPGCEIPPAEADQEQAVGI